MVADFQYKPLFENLLEHRAAVVKRGFVRPHSGQPRNLAKTGAIFEGLVLSPFHRLVDVASKHRLNDTKVEETGLAAHGRGGGHRLRPGHHVHGAANPGCSRLSAGDCGSEDSHTARHSRLKGGCGQDCPPHNKCRMPRPGKVCGIGRKRLPHKHARDTKGARSLSRPWMVRQIRRRWRGAGPTFRPTRSRIRGGRQPPDTGCSTWSTARHPGAWV